MNKFNKIIDKILNIVLNKISKKLNPYCGVNNYGVRMDIFFNIMDFKNWDRFVTDYNLILDETNRIKIGNTKTYFYSDTIFMYGIKVKYYSPRFENPDFDREACIYHCAEEKENHRVLMAHLDERDIEGTVARIKAKKEIGCTSE